MHALDRQLNRIMPPLIGVLVIILLERVLFFPRDIYWVFPLLIVSIGISIWQLSERQLFGKQFLSAAILPIELVAAGQLFLLYLEASWLRHAVVLLVGTLLALFIEVIRLRLHDRPKYQPHALENISSHVGVVTCFLLFSALHSMAIFLAIPIGILSPIAFVVAALLFYQLLWASEIPLHSSWLYVGTIAIVLTEFFIAVYFLPTSAYVGGAVVTVCYYVCGGIIRNWLHDIREPRVIRRYVVTAIVVAVIILSTAKWY